MDPVTAEHPKRAWVEQIMGMPISIQLRGPGLRGDGAIAVHDRAAGAVAATFDQLRQVDAVFSTWIPDSQVSRLARGELALAACDPQVRDVVRLCAEAREVTEGWFDAGRLPGEPDGGSDRGGRAFDPTGLVKGWAVQRACSVLAGTLPEHDVLINAGGDIAVSCGRADTPPWRLGIENPADRAETLARVELRSGGLATSGTAARGHHIISPATGLPATGLASVSVIGPSLMWADVYATAAFARGPGCVDWLRTLPGCTWLVVGPDGSVHQPDR
jgi:thiamine biosynthesis lipoprotein